MPESKEYKMRQDSVLIGVIALGTVGILVPIFNLIGNSQPQVMVGIMISGSVIFGCGIIATVIAQKK